MPARLAVTHLCVKSMKKSRNPMRTLDLEKKLATVVDKLGVWRTLCALLLKTESADEVGDRHVLPHDCQSFRPFTEPYYLLREHSCHRFRARFTVPALAPLSVVMPECGHTD